MFIHESIELFLDRSAETAYFSSRAFECLGRETVCMNVRERFVKFKSENHLSHVYFRIKSWSFNKLSTTSHSLENFPLFVKIKLSAKKGGMYLNEKYKGGKVQIYSFQTYYRLKLYVFPKLL